MIRLAQLHFLCAQANVTSVGISNRGQRAAGGLGSHFACRHLERTVVVAAVNIQANEDVGLIIVVSNHEVGVVYHCVAVQNIVATRQRRPDDGQLIVGFFSSNQLVIVGNFSLAEVHQGIVTSASSTNSRTISVSHGLGQLSDGVDNRLSSRACAFQLRHVSQGQFKGVLLAAVERLAVLLQQRDRRRSGQHVSGHGNLELVETVGGLLAHDGLVKRCISHNTHEDTLVAGGRSLEANLHRAVVNEQSSVGHFAHGERRVVAVLVDAGSNVVRAAQNAHLRGVHDNGRARAVAAACGQVVVATFGQGHRCLAFSVGHNALKFGHRASRCVHRGKLDAFQSGSGSLHGGTILVQVAVHGGNARHGYFKGRTSKSLSRNFNVGVLISIRIGLIGVELNEVTAVDLRGGNQGAIVAAGRRFGAIVRGRMVHKEAIGSVSTEVRLHPTGIRPIQHGLSGIGSESLFAEHIDSGSNHNVSCGNTFGSRNGVRIAVGFCQVTGYFLVCSGSSQVSAGRLRGVAHGCRCGGLGGNSSARNGERHVVLVQRDGRVNPGVVGLTERNCLRERTVVGLKTAAVAVNDRQGERAISGFDDAFGCQRGSFSSANISSRCIGGDDSRLGVAVRLRTANGIQRCSGHRRSLARHRGGQRSLTFVVARPQRFSIGIQLEHAGVHALPECLRACLVSSVVALA